MSAKRRVLGRGLSALLPTHPEPANEASASRSRNFFQAAIEDVYPGPDQPRRRFADTELDELAESIRAHGIIQPLIVRARPQREGGGFYLIAGERRWRAAQRAGLLEVPVVVQEVDSNEAFERALVENLQREDLNPIEEAAAYFRMVGELGYTQEQVAGRVGKERSTVANSLRLLKLPMSVRHMVEEQELSMGHARAILGLDDVTTMETVARRVVSKGLSVRATEALIRSRQATPARRTVSNGVKKKSAAVRDLENRLTKALGAQVSLAESPGGKGGAIEIRYIDLDDLDRLLVRLLRD